MTHTRPSDAVVSLKRPIPIHTHTNQTNNARRSAVFAMMLIKVSFRSARSPSARTMRSPLSVAPTRAARARSQLSTVSSGSSTSTASTARSPTASPSPSASPPPRSSSPRSSSTRTARRSLPALPRAVSSTRRRPRRLKYLVWSYQIREKFHPLTKYPLTTRATTESTSLLPFSSERVSGFSFLIGK
jgi:hypothetical protein